MLNEVHETGSDYRIASRAVSNPEFRTIFRETDRRSMETNRRKALRWWRTPTHCTDKSCSEQGSVLNFTSRAWRSNAGRVRHSIKAKSGRVPQLQPRAQYVRDLLLKNVKGFGSWVVRFHLLY